jgi:uncharacterized circularly permuted ATP-grasp superfamily protein
MGALPRTVAGAVQSSGYDLNGFHDEAFEPDGAPRAAYADMLDKLGDADLAQLADGVAADIGELGASFGSGRERERFHTDPVPRIFDRGEWELLERGLAQRARALTAFVADVYADRRVVAEGVVPARVIDGCTYFEPWMIGVELPDWAWVPLGGIDVVRGADGRLRVLEDNLRTPSGLTYASAARSAADAHLPGGPSPARRSLAEAYEAIAAALRAAAPDGIEEPSVVLLSDGPSNSAWYEHLTLARRLGIPLVTPGDLYERGGGLHAFVADGSREVHVVYRRTDEDRLRDEQGRPTWVAELLLDPCRRGRVACVNAFGTGVADDKLLHAYADEMVRFYLGEEPLIESVRTYDLGDEACREEALDRVGELVVKPRAGHGGHGIVVGPHATREDRALIARRVSARPEDWVAQETVRLSRHPTVEDGELVPRHVDLRAFTIAGPGGVAVAPGGLTRFARAEGSLVVNSSQGGGGKDTWVLR